MGKMSDDVRAEWEREHEWALRQEERWDDFCADAAEAAQLRKKLAQTREELDGRTEERDVESLEAERQKAAKEEARRLVAELLKERGKPPIRYPEDELAFCEKAAKFIKEGTAKKAAFPKAWRSVPGLPDADPSTMRRVFEKWDNLRRKLGYKPRVEDWPEPPKRGRPAKKHG